jgi:hypothetical protein
MIGRVPPGIRALIGLALLVVGIAAHMVLLAVAGGLALVISCVQVFGSRRGGGAGGGGFRR